jgi:hypothetical protein
MPPPMLPRPMNAIAAMAASPVVSVAGIDRSGVRHRPAPRLAFQRCYPVGGRVGERAGAEHRDFRLAGNPDRMVNAPARRRGAFPRKRPCLRPCPAWR